MTEPKQSTFDPGVSFLYYTVGGYEYNNNPDHDAEVIKPYAMSEDSILPWVLGDDNWNGTAFTNGVKALLIKEWSI